MLAVYDRNGISCREGRQQGEKFWVDLNQTYNQARQRDQRNRTVDIEYQKEKQKEREAQQAAEAAAAAAIPSATVTAPSSAPAATIPPSEPRPGTIAFFIQSSAAAQAGQHQVEPPTPQPIQVESTPQPIQVESTPQPVQVESTSQPVQEESIPQPTSAGADSIPEFNFIVLGDEEEPMQQ